MDSAKELVTAFADRLERRDWAGLAELLAEDVVYELPQTRERIRGRDRYVTFNAEYPGDWHIAPRVILGDDHNGSLLFEWALDDERSLAIALLRSERGPHHQDHRLLARALRPAARARAPHGALVTGSRSTSGISRVVFF